MNDICDTDNGALSASSLLQQFTGLLQSWCGTAVLTCGDSSQRDQLLISKGRPQLLVFITSCPVVLFGMQCTVFTAGTGQEPAEKVVRRDSG